MAVDKKGKGASATSPEKETSTSVSSSLSSSLSSQPPPLPLADQKGGCFANRFRFFLLILVTFCLTSVFSNMITINFTITCMSDPGIYNHTVHHYTQFDKTALQWTVAIAAAIATFPFSWLCTHYGARWVFFVCGISSAICTGLIPAAANLGFFWFCVLRVFQGLAYACDFAVIGVLCTRWASLKENAKFIGVLTCFSPLSSFLTNVFAGAICDSWLGWEWVHYTHAIASLLLFTGWIIFYSDDPSKSPFVSVKELANIHKHKTETHRHHESYVPYWEICKDRVVQAVWLNAFADLLSGFFLFIFAPTYISKVLHYSSTETGILGALVAITHIPVKMCCGWVSDSFHCLPERKKMWIFNTIAVGGPALVYVYLCFAPKELPLLTVTLFGSVHALLGFNCGGFYKAGSLVSRQYAEFVIAMTQFIKCVVYFVAPAMVAIFVTDESNAQQWHMIFYIIAATLVVANLVFCIYATDEAAAFTKLSSKDRGGGGGGADKALSSPI